VVDVFVDKCRYPPGFDDCDTPALVFPRLVPLIQGNSKWGYPSTLLTWRGFLAIGVALHEYLVELQRMSCSHLDIKPKNIVLGTDDWSRIMPSDVYVIDYEMLTPFGYVIADVAGTEGFWHFEFGSMKQGMCSSATTGPRLDVSSVGCTLRSLMGDRSCEPCVMGDASLKAMVEALMYHPYSDSNVPPIMSQMVKTLDKLCSKHRMPFRPVP
jgi:serine/threonine protein kinase